MAAVEADLELHRELMRTSGNRRMLQLWNQISEQIRFVIAVTQHALPEIAWAHYNRPIIEAVASGDPRPRRTGGRAVLYRGPRRGPALSPDAFDRVTRRPNTVASRAAG